LRAFFVAGTAITDAAITDEVSTTSQYNLAGSPLTASVAGHSPAAVFWLAGGLMTPVNFRSTHRHSVSQVLIQRYVPGEYRGRVMSFYVMQASVMKFRGFGVTKFAETTGVQSVLQYILAAPVTFTVGKIPLVPGPAPPRLSPFQPPAPVSRPCSNW
jgi:hypothetical protein